MVGLNVVNMKLDKICTRYLLSYPPSYGMDICEKIRASFERGIRKAIPLQAQRAGVFNNAFEVLLWQSEPLTMAVKNQRFKLTVIRPLFDLILIIKNIIPIC